MAKNIYISSGTTVIDSVDSDYYHVYNSGGVRIFSGGQAEVYVGHAGNSSSGSGGFAVVHSGGRIFGAVENWGRLVVLSGGRASRFTFAEHGDTSIERGGKCHQCDVSSGGNLNISGGEAVWTTVRSSGNLVLSSFSSGDVFQSGCAVNTDILNAGTMRVCSGAFARNNEINGTVWVENGGIAHSNFVDTGKLIVESGGTATTNHVSSGGSLIISGYGTATTNHVSSGGSLIISGYGTATTNHVSSGGFMYVQGSANSNYISSGGSMGIYNGGITTSTTVGALMDIYSGGIASLTTVSAYGKMSIDSGGTAAATTVNLGGAMFVYGGKALGGDILGGELDIKGSGIAMETLIASGGYAVIHNNGVLFGGSAVAGGIISALSGGNAALCVISSGGTIKCYDGANVTYSLIESGGKITGAYNCSSLVFSSGGIADFNISDRYAGNTSAFVSELGEAISQSAVFTLSVYDTQANGTYKLASGAAGFDKTITVQNTAGTPLGTLEVGQTTKIGGVDYKIELDSDDVLSVTVNAAVPAGPAKSDIDGNGVSDVMFVWTGEHGEGNYQHGYWMNGTSEWQSANCGHPANWDNLGNYDMTGDGKADSVLFGNVDAYEVPSAYIGYYKDGVDTDENWVTIGFLTNAAGIDWKNAVGNLTGGSSNSIVWHAAELGALGAWTDGTDNWINLGGGFDSTWTLIGCGDFDGDGKDSVLMSYNNGELFYTVGIDEAPVALGSANWSGWEVRAIGDFSGDGKDDIILFWNATGEVKKLINGNAANSVSLGYLSNETIYGCGDYDGDCKDDLLVQTSTGMLGYYSEGILNGNHWEEMGTLDSGWTVIA